MTRKTAMTASTGILPDANHAGRSGGRESTLALAVTIVKRDDDAKKWSTISATAKDARTATAAEAPAAAPPRCFATREKSPADVAGESTTQAAAAPGDATPDATRPLASVTTACSHI